MREHMRTLLAKDSPVFYHVARKNAHHDKCRTYKVFYPYAAMRYAVRCRTLHIRGDNTLTRRYIRELAKPSRRENFITKS